MVANRTLKAKARLYAEDFGVPYPRALADLTAPGLSVPLVSHIPSEWANFDPEADRYLILTGDFEFRAAILERVFGRFYFKPHVERFMIDVTGDLHRPYRHFAEDGAQGYAGTPEAAINVLNSVIHNARHSHSDPKEQFDVLTVHGLQELLAVSPQSGELLVELMELACPQQAMILAGDWIGSQPVPGGPKLGGATRLHAGRVGDAEGLSEKNRQRWLDLAPTDGDVVYQKRGFLPVKGTLGRATS